MILDILWMICINMDTVVGSLVFLKITLQNYPLTVDRLGTLHGHVGCSADDPNPGSCGHSHGEVEQWRWDASAGLCCRGWNMNKHWGWGCSIMRMIIIILLLKHVFSINLYHTVFLDVELVIFLFSLQVWEPDVCKSATSMALEAGFRFIWSSTLATCCRKSIYQGPTVTSGWNP